MSKRELQSEKTLRERRMANLVDFEDQLEQGIIGWGTALVAIAILFLVVGGIAFLRQHGAV